MFVSYVTNIRLMHTLLHEPHACRCYAIVLVPWIAGRIFSHAASKISLCSASTLEYPWSALLWVLKWTGLAAATMAVSIHEKKCRGGKIHCGDDAGRMGESRLGKESHATVHGVAFFRHLVLSTCQGRIPRLVENTTTRRLVTRRVR